MKKQIVTYLSTLMVFAAVSSATYAQPNGSATLIEIRMKLAKQKSDLAHFQDQLRQSKMARRSTMTIEVAADVMSVLSSLNGILSPYEGHAPLLQNAPYFADGDNTGNVMIPAVAAGIGGVGVLAYTENKGFTQVQLRTADINTLMQKVAVKLADIEKAESLLKAIQP